MVLQVIAAGATVQAPDMTAQAATLPQLTLQNQRLAIIFNESTF